MVQKTFKKKQKSKSPTQELGVAKTYNWAIKACKEFNKLADKDGIKTGTLKRSEAAHWFMLGVQYARKKAGKKTY